MLTDNQASVTIDAPEFTGDTQEVPVEENTEVQVSPIEQAITALIDAKVQAAISEIDIAAEVETAIDDIDVERKVERAVEDAIEYIDFEDKVRDAMPSGVDDFDFYSWSGETPDDFVRSGSLDEVTSEVETLTEKVNELANLESAVETLREFVENLTPYEASDLDSKFDEVFNRLDAIEDAIRNFGGSI